MTRRFITVIIFTHPTIQENVDGRGRALGDGSLSVNGPQSNQGPDGVTDVISTVGKRAESGGEDL